MGEPTLESIGFQNLPYLEEKYFDWLEGKSKDWEIPFAPYREPLETLQVRKFRTEKKETTCVEETYRSFGHKWAHLSPIHAAPTQPREIPVLDMRLKNIYSGWVGVEFLGFVPPEVEAFLIERLEVGGGFSNALNPDEKKQLLDRLNHSELFETFLHTRFPGQKRFSLEGAETLIPMMMELLKGKEEVVIGMAHRGRLNVLSNILKKGYEEIFAEFREGYVPKGRSGDVKYHLGYQTIREGLTITLLPNPSHLESVYPVLEGYSRARVDEGIKVQPIVIHGDAALSGQGVVYETLQFQRLPGYKVGGTIHLVINNQIGFTTLPEEGRSTFYCTDLAKTFGCPIFHVNEDHPEEAIVATRLALEVKERFGIDVFLDLVCYRKYGHNEGDEPAFTQPIEYKVIRSRPSVREIYRDQLIQEGHLERSIAEAGEESFKKALQKALDTPLGEEKGEGEQKEALRKPLKNPTLQELKKLAEEATYLPPEFAPHPKISQLYQNRREAILNDQPLDWGTVEMMAYASLLKAGVPIRLTGQDTGRGTFSHRQLRLTDQKTGDHYIPLQHLYKEEPSFQLFNSPLSEYASVAFEYGYSIAEKQTLVIWEAQFGDFANGAQIVFDQYLSSAERKWGQHSSLVLFLPHGFEGQGPEHSSARLERFLTLAGEDNMRIVYPTLPAQLFHVLEEQAAKDRPLVVLTPKELLRHPRATSKVDDLVNGHFQKVILDPSVGDVHTLVLVSGRFYVELEPKEGFAYLRVEQLYPFPKEEIEQVIKRFSKLKRVVWCQEEPKNMGAWTFVNDQMPGLIYVGRERRASPACGSHQLHEIEEEAILEMLWSFKW